MLSIFELTPDIDLNVMKKGQDLFDVTSNILLKMRDTLREVKPDLVLVHGDTTTTFTTSLACFYLGVKVGHIEAGLRTHNIHAPFPEEYNRQSTGIIASFHFSPTNLSKQNAIAEFDVIALLVKHEEFTSRITMTELENKGALDFCGTFLK